MATIQQQIEVIIQEGLGRPATQQDLDYYSERGIDLLESNLRKDPNARGKYAQPDVSNAPAEGGPDATTNEPTTALGAVISVIAGADTIAEAGFRIKLAQRDGANMVNTNYYPYTWIAIGPKP